MIIEPDCLSIDNTLKLESSVVLNSGQSIPNYISYNSATHDFRIIDPPESQSFINHNMVLTFNVIKGSEIKLT